jgi:hypothetical protein
MIQVEITVPHILDVGGQRYRAGDLDCRVELVHDGDGWALDQVEISLVGHDGKWNWVVIPKDDPIRASVLCEAYGPSRFLLDDAWTDYVTDGGWKKGRAA